MFDNLNNIRFLIIIFVVLNHISFSPLAITGGNLKSLNFFFESTSPVLAILSGFLFFYGTSDTFNYRQKLNRRLYSLVLPYFFWISFYIVLHLTIKPIALYLIHRPVWISEYPSFTIDYFVKAFFISPIVANFWYLQNLIAILPFCYLIWHLLRNRIIYLIAFFGVVMIYTFHVFPIYFSERFLPYFLIGAYLGYQKYKWDIFSEWGRSYINLLLLITLIIPNYFSYENGGIIFKCISVFACSALLIQSFKRGLPVLLERFLSQNERHSFFVFCQHMIVISLISKCMGLVLPSLLFRNRFFYSILCIVLFASSLLMCLWISRLLEKYYKSVWNLIVGFRITTVHKPANTATFPQKTIPSPCKIG